MASRTTTTTSKDLLDLEHRSKEQHLERLLAKRTKPNIERLRSSVLQDVQRFLPLMRKANEQLDSPKLPPQAGDSLNEIPSEAAETASAGSSDTGRSELCCEVGDDFEGSTIEMNLMFASSDEVKMVTDIEAIAGAPKTHLAHINNDEDSDVGDTLSEDSDSDSNSEDENGNQIKEAPMGSITTNDETVVNSNQTHNSGLVSKEIQDTLLTASSPV